MELKIWGRPVILVTDEQLGDYDPSAFYFALPDAIVDDRLPGTTCSVCGGLVAGGDLCACKGAE